LYLFGDEKLDVPSHLETCYVSFDARK
jgi:hypothetical protein